MIFTKKIAPPNQLDLALTLVNLGNLLLCKDKASQAEENYLEALAIFQGLAKSNPRAYLPDVAMLLLDLSACYIKLERKEDSIENASNSIFISIQFFEIAPRVRSYYEAAIENLQFWGLKFDGLNTSGGKVLLKLKKNDSGDR